MINVCPFPIQRELSQQTDLAARLYRESTPVTQMSATDIWDVMIKAHDKMTKIIRLYNFEKYIFVGHKDNGDDFFHGVRHIPFQFILNLFYALVGQIIFLILCFDFE